MERVVITGMGLVSSLGRRLEDVHHALLHGHSGIRFNPSYQEAGLKSQISGQIQADPASEIERGHLRFMPPASIYAYLAMKDALADSNLPEELLHDERTGLIVGSGGASPLAQIEAEDKRRASGVRQIGPYGVTKNMCSTTSACLATFFGIKGPSFSISAACTTGLHCAGNAFVQIQAGLIDRAFCGGSEEESYALSMLFDAMGALSTRYNDTPQKASRPFDRSRDGFVISGGGGILLLESLTSAKARGAKIYGEIVGYGFSSDGDNMVAPSGEGAIRCMKMALASRKPDYINAHGTGTPVGDTREVGAMEAVFGSKSAIPPVSSTKSLSGHSQGATGAQELIFSLLMMQHDFIAPSINIDELDEAVKGVDIVTETRHTKLNLVLSNSFGFGGTNGSMLLSRYED